MTTIRIVGLEGQKWFDLVCAIIRHEDCRDTPLVTWDVTDDHRTAQLLEANNRAVEKRREATTLLREAAAQFRFYEQQHAAKGTPDGDVKARTNCEFAGRIETFLQEIHQ